MHPEQQGVIESFTTAELAPRQRRHFWNEVNTRVFTPLDVKPRSPDEFHGELHRLILGPLTVSRAISSAAEVIHSERGVRRTTEQVVLVHLQASGVSVNRQDGREALLKPGDFTLCDSSRPYSVEFDAPTDVMVVRIAAPLLSERVVLPERFTARRISGDTGVGSLVSTLLRHVWLQSSAAGLDARIVDRLSANLLDLLVTALCEQQPERVRESAATNAQWIRVRCYIEDHLTDARLDARTIGTAMHISARYVHRLFEGRQETLGQFVLRRRLEESAKRLRDPAYALRSVTEIAFDCAFTDASYFGRCFRKHFGVTPRDYRLARDLLHQP
jgi:AraC-like DNA-binding protein